MRKYFLSLDLEEWSDLEYLKKYSDRCASAIRFIPDVIPFLEELAGQGIYLSVFVVGTAARRHPDIVRRIDSMGHEIACHSLDHALLHDQSTEQFIAETIEARNILENVIGKKVIGYRAPCFSLNNEKLEALWLNGFVYDASLIRFKEHALYGKLDMQSYNAKEDLVFEKNGKFVFEMPTLAIFGKSIPISGGGYFRIFPLPAMKHLNARYWQKSTNFAFYIHPFELSESSLDVCQKFATRDRLRFSIGRAGNREKLRKYLSWARYQGCVFYRFSDYISEVAQVYEPK